MIRARQFAGGLERASYPIRLNVFWRMDTADASELLRRLTEMPQDEEPYPIEIYRVHDPDWEHEKSRTPT